jgi:hypothetical protein
MQINRENSRYGRNSLQSSGTGYADITKGLEEVIDYFSTTKYLRYSSGSKFLLPSVTTTGEDYYLINKVLSYQDFRVNSSNTSVSANQLVDTTATFTATVTQGDIVVNTSTYESSEISAVVSDTVLSLDDDIFTTFPQTYSIFSSDQNEAEKVSNSKITMLNTSTLTKPTKIFPVYSEEGSLINLLPKTIKNEGSLLAQYIRYPKEPKWTFVSILGGEPVFDQTQPDYQDFELPLDDAVTLVTKILQYAGLSIREVGVVQFGQAEEVKESQK